MYYYGKDQITEIEDLVMDFLVYRRSKKSPKVPDYKIQNYEIGEGWPHYQNHPLLTQNESAAPLPMNEWKAIPLKPEESVPCPEQLKAPLLPQPIKALPCPKNYPEEIPNMDITFFSRHYGTACKLLHIHAKEVIKQYEYKGSPVYDEHIDRKFLLEITEKVLGRAQTSEKEVEKIMQKTEREDWDSYHLLCSLAECLVLIEIHMCRKAKHKQYVKNDWNYVEYI